MLKGTRILAIDDSLAIRNYLRRMLIRQCAVVDLASSGRQGLKMCAGESGNEYDLILLDLIMPDMNGIDVLKEIRENDQDTTVIILTGVGGVRSAISAVRGGADAYVEKQDVVGGSGHEEFFYVIEQALERRAGVIAQRQLEEVKTNFHSLVAHDLRSPAGNVLAVARMLLAGDGGPLTGEQIGFLNIIEKAANKMFSGINDYLDLAMIDAGYLRLNLGDVDLRDVVRASVDSVELPAQAKNHTLSVDLPADPVLARADAERLQQVLENLLTNAIRNSPERGQIPVQLVVEDSEAVFRITDTGIGIAPEQLPVLFAKYRRVSGESTVGISGAGLGLLIVKEIVEAHKGTVRAESEGLDKGATFIVSIPLRMTGPPAVIEAVAEA